MSDVYNEYALPSSDDSKINQYGDEEYENIKQLEELDEDSRNNLLTDQLLSYLIKNPKEYTKFSFLDKLLKNEDYIIFFDLKESIKNGIELNREILKMSLEANVTSWKNKNSILFRVAHSTMDKDYIQLKSSQELITDSDFTEAFIDIVLYRFDQLINTEVKLNFESEYLKQMIVQMVEGSVGLELVGEVSDIIKSGKYYKGKYYGSNDIIKYVRGRISDIDIELSDTSKFDDYSTYIMNKYLEVSVLESKCFNWNVGKSITLPTVNKSYLVSVLGQSKIGKTKFVTGEMAYPAIMSGKNVLYLSGEMGDTQMMSIMTSKHIYAKKGFKISSNEVTSCITISNILEQMSVELSEYLGQRERYINMINGILSPSEYKEKFILDEEVFKTLYKMNDLIETYSKLTPAKREIIINYFDDILTNPFIGRIYVLEKEDKVFDVDNMYTTISSLIDKYNADMVVYDHAGLAYSESNKGKVEIMTLCYQIGKDIAKRSKNPVSFIIINHIATDASETISKKGTIDSESLRAHNTSEARKSADLELALYTDGSLEKEGAINLQVTICRNESFTKDPIVFTVDYMVNDFVAMGSTKDEYKVV